MIGRGLAVVSAGLLFVGGLGWLVGCGSETPEAVPDSQVESSEWSVRASVDKSEVQVGEDLTLSLDVRHPPGGDFITPYGAELEPFGLIEREEEELSPIETVVRYRLGAYHLPGAVEVPSLTLQYRGEDGELAPLPTEAIAVRIVTSLTPEVTDIHDIKDPVALSVPSRWELLWWLLLAILLAILAYIIYRKLRKEPAAVEARPWIAPPPPPYDEARAALRDLADKKLVEKGVLEAFYSELAEIMKRYGGRRFGVPFLERTTDEVLGDLRQSTEMDEGLLPELGAILNASDLVKFAKFLPEEEAARGAFRKAERFLEATRPRPEGDGALANRAGGGDLEATA